MKALSLASMARKSGETRERGGGMFSHLVNLSQKRLLEADSAHCCELPAKYHLQAQLTTAQERLPKLQQDEDSPDHELSFNGEEKRRDEKRGGGTFPPSQKL